MKKLLFFVVVFCCINALFAATSPVTPDIFELFSLTQENSNTLEIEFNLSSEFEFITNTIDDKEYLRIYHPSAGFIMNEGLPELPIFSATIAIPATGNPRIDMTVSDDIEVVTDVDYYPSQGPDLVYDSTRGLIINQDFYSKNASYPDNLFRIGEPAVLRDFRIVNVSFSPFSYNPVLRELTIHNKMRVRIVTDNAPGTNEIQVRSRLSRSFENVYRSTILNYEQVRDPSWSYQDRSLLIIYHHNPTIVNIVNEIYDWKRQKGFEVTAVNTSTMSSTSAIKTYIQNAYNTWDNPPEYIMLIGSGNGAMSIPYWTVNSGAGDHPYALLEGNDDIADAFIGRLYVDTSQQLATVWNKIKNYERIPYMSNTNWYSNALLVGDPASSGTSTIITSKYIKELMLDYNPESTFSEIYSSPFPSQINNAINNGVFLYSYRGYIGMSSWSPGGHSNGYMLPNCLFITCSTLYYTGTSKTTDMVLQGTPTAASGGITAIGMTTSATKTAYNNTLTGGIAEGIYVGSMRTMGEALMRGKTYLHQVYDTVHPTYPPLFSQWANLIGDPSMDIWVAEPKIMNVAYNEVIAKGQNFIDVTVTDGEGLPLDNAWVTIRKGDDIVFATGYTDIDGNITHYFDPENEGVVLVTVTKPDYHPYLGDFEITDTGQLGLDNVVVNDSFDSGSTVDLAVIIKNFSSQNATGISGVLSSETEFVTVINGESSFSDLSPGDTSENTDSFTVSIAANIADHMPVPFLVTFTDAQDNVSYGRFVLAANGNKLKPVDWTVSDGNNGVLEPGETATLRVTVQNQGQVNLNEVYGILRSSNPLLDISDSTAYFGNIAIGGSITSSPTNSFQVTALEDLLPGMTIDMEVYLYNDSGYDGSGHFSLPIGVITVSDPLGPDNYGYYIYDEGDTDYEHAPLYDWIEIAPTLGGSGINTNLQSDGSNIQQVMNMDLPFSFRFYGSDYDVVSICANGWISFGVTEQASFRNHRLPGPMGPSPIVAAFWDNLRLTSGAVYTYYDQDLDVFIIQWQNALNHYNTAPETFQIILYNSDAEETVDDNLIKIQYKIFNNVNSGANSPYGHWGNYATIGIADHTGTDGLEYTFANQYPTAALPLGNETALMIVGPKNYNDPFLLRQSVVVFDENNSGYIDAGENVSLGIYIKNIGYATATEVIGTISTTSPYITITNDTSEYYDITTGAELVNKDFFTLNVSATTPNNYVANFDIAINSPNVQASFPFQLTVYKPVLHFDSYMIRDLEGNNDGILNPGETADLVLNFYNDSNTGIQSATLTAQTANPCLTIHTPNLNYGDIPPFTSVQKSLSIAIDETCNPESIVAINIQLSSPNINNYTKTINLGIEVEDVFLDFETDDGNFTSNNDNGWQWGEPNIDPYSGSYVWGTVLSGNYPDAANMTLDSPEFLVTPSSQLSFNHYYDIEEYWDGGNIKISTDNGNSWQIAYPLEGYPVNNVNSGNAGIPNQPAYSGNSNGWQLANFDFSTFLGELVKVRWHFGSGPWVNSTGWFIDNVLISGTNTQYSSITGNITLLNSPVSVQEVLVKAGEFSVKPNANGNYELVVPAGSYSVTASLPFHHDETIIEVEVDVLDTVSDIDFTLNYLTPPENLFYIHNQEIHTVQLSWDYYSSASRENPGRNSGIRDDEVVFLVNRQQDSGTFEVIATTDVETMEYTDVLPQPGSVYRYFIVAQYPFGVSARSNEVATDEEPTSIEIIEPERFVLRQNYPNPFNPVTNISFSLPQKERVLLKIYDIKGRLVKTLLDDYMSTGNHTVQWNGLNDRNRSVSSGVYFYRIEAGKHSEVRKAVLLK
jgi:hypothetical protein